MTRNFERLVAAFAAVLIMTASFAATVSVPSRAAVLASSATPVLA